MKKKTGGLVYSTNPDVKIQDDGQDDEVALPPSQQKLYIVLERLKGNKVATLIENFIGSNTELELLGKELKSKCGSGGSAKDGLIIIQGDHRDRLLEYLLAKGYKAKKKGG